MSMSASLISACTSATGLCPSNSTLDRPAAARATRSFNGPSPTILRGIPCSEPVPGVEHRPRSFLGREAAHEQGVPASSLARTGIWGNEVGFHHDLPGREATLDEFVPGELGKRNVDVDHLRPGTQGAVEG